MTTNSTTKVMTSNLLFGGGERLDLLLAIYARERPDLLVLQECLGWGELEMQSVARAIGVPAEPRHMSLAEANPRRGDRRFHVAIFSRPPLLEVAVHREGFGHVLVEATLAPTPSQPPWRVFATHLVATDDDARAKEIARFVELLGPRDLATEPVLFVGDLNALSRQDPYPPDLGEQLALAGISKYGQPPRFDVMDSVFARGFVDSLAFGTATRSGGAGQSSWVTARRGPPEARVETRTDYVLLSPSLLGSLLESRVVDVGQASDHDAVSAVFG